MTPAASLTITVVHAPGAVSQQCWAQLRRRAAGRASHELRLVVQGPDQPSGTQLSVALREWVENAYRSDQTWCAEVCGHPLDALPAESALIHPGMVVLLRAPRTRRTAGSRHGSAGSASSLRVCVDRGPDAGQLITLRRGQHAVGRSCGRIRLADPSAAREHLLVDVGSAQVTLHCLSGTPAVTMAGRPRRRAAWDSSMDLTVGASTLQLISGPPEGPSDADWPVAAEPVGEKPPEGRHRMMLLMALLPMIIGIVLVAVTGMWFFLLFSAVSGLVALATVLDARRRRRRFRRAVRTAAEAWAQRADGALPTPGRLIQLLRLWRTGPSSAPLRAGSTSRPEEEIRPPTAGLRHAGTASVVVRAGTGLVEPELQMESGHQTDDASAVGPIAVALSPGEQTLVLGSARESGRLLRWLLAQLVIRPADQRPSVLLVEPEGSSGRIGEGDLSPLEDLPQVVRLSERRLTEALDDDADQRERLDALAEGSAVTPVLLAATEVDPETVTHFIAGRWHVITADRRDTASAGRSPGTTLDLESGRAGRRGAIAETEADSAVFDGLSDTTLAEHCRLALPLCTGVEADAAIPSRWSVQLPAELMAGSAVEALTTLIGRGTGCVEHLDLVGDGPHILVAGTSGSGKSELLKAMLLGWAARYSPDEVNFMLFDFKGGSTFHRIAQLEHSLGLVTDLSQAQAERTLEGIRSELVRREQLFLDADAGDYAEYRRRRPDHPLARILVVFDEFRIFAHELPDTMDELMRLATLGRSLGLHLVLATQRPQGVVTADIRANIGSTLALRLRSEDESRDLVGSPEAGRIPRDVPGRGVIRRPGEAPRSFQTVQLHTGDVPITLVAEGHRDHQWSQECAEGTGSSTEPDEESPSDANVSVVAELSAQVRSRCLQRAHTPLLPPPPTQLSDAEVLVISAASTDQFENALALNRAHTGTAVLGLIDDPAAQRQTPLKVDPVRPQSLALLGEGESGGREALAALARLLLDSGTSQIHLLDGDRSLQGFATHPAAGSWITDEHLDEAEYFLEALKDVLHRRRARGGAPGTSAGSTSGSPATEAPIVVLMSGHSQWHAAGQSAGFSSVDTTLGTLISDGPAVGISVIISGGRELAGGRVGSRIARRIFLPFGVSEDTRYLWPKVRHTDPSPGRGVLISPDHPAPGVTVQLIDTVESRETAAPDETGLSSGTGPSDGVNRADSQLRVRPLPEQLWVSELPNQTARTPVTTNRESPGVVVGVERFTHDPAVLELGEVNLITGLPGSGRSGCLRLLAEQLPSCLLFKELAVDDGAETTSQSGVLLVDDADALPDQDHRRIEELIQTGMRVVAACRPSMTLFSQVPWAHRARSSPGNVLLSPTHRSQVDPFTVSVPLLDRLIPGRAVHLRQDGPRSVQWAHSTV